MKLRLLAIFVLLLGSGLFATRTGTAQVTNQEPGIISPITGEVVSAARGNDEGQHTPLLSSPGSVTVRILGALYGTDGQNLYQIDRKTGSTTLIGPHGPGAGTIGALAFDSSGVLYGMSIGDAAALYKINPTNGAATLVGPLGFFVFEGGLDFNAAGQLFGTNWGNDNAAKMFTINLSTGAGTVVGPNPGQNRDINGLAFNGETFYAIDRVSNTLGIISPINGAYTPIGNTGATVDAAGGLALDPVDGTLYAVFGVPGTGGGFYTLNKSTGVATWIAATNVVYGLAISPGMVIYIPMAMH